MMKNQQIFNWLIAACCLLFSGSVMAQPLNNLCAGAFDLAEGVNELGTNVGANNTGALACNFAGDGASGVWYTFMGNGETAVVSTVNPGTNFDTQLAVYSGTCDALVCEAGNDDATGLQSTVVFTTMGVQYFAYVDGFGTSAGNFELSLEFVAPPANDLCADAIELVPGENALGTNAIAGNTGALACDGAGDGASGVWYTFMGNGETAIVSTVNPGTNFDTQLAVYSGTCDALVCEAGNDDTGGLQSTVIFTTMGVQYFVYVDGFFTSTGDFELSLELPEPPLPPGSLEISVTSISNINVTLNEDCEAMLVPRQVLVGDFDVDGDGNEPGNMDFNIVVQDENPCNGPIIDGCGTYIYTINNGGIAGRTLNGFGESLAGDGCVPVEGFTNVPDPATQSASVEITADTVFLRTMGGSNLTDPLEAGIIYDFPAAGNFNFFATFESDDLPFDGFIISFDGTLSPLDIDFDFANVPLPGIPLTGDPNGIPVEPGDRLVLILREDDGFTFPNDADPLIRIFDFVYNVDPAAGEITGFTNGWGYVNAEDKTSPVAALIPTAPAELFCSEFDGVNINTLNSSVSRCWIQSGDDASTVDGSMDALLRAKLIAGGGVPNFTDGCSDVEICVNDVVTRGDACDDVTILRKFTARDGLSCTSVSGEENAPTLAEYTITFTSPGLDEVVGVPEEARFECDEFDAAGPNPAPNADDFPFLLRADGSSVFLGASFCNLGATYVDGPRIITCENTYKFVRTFTVVDWCDVDTIATYNQVVKVGDFVAPTLVAPTQDLNFDGVADSGPLFFSTNSLDCTAFIDLIGGASATDNCDASPTISAVVFPNGDRTATPLGPYDGSTLAGGFPRGTHLVVYYATDACDNRDTLELDILIDDRTAPVAICEDGLNVSIGGNGTAQLCATDINRASYDDCSDVTLSITRANSNNGALAPYQDCITITCDEISATDANGDPIADLRVSLQVVDGAGNVNTCWLNVVVEDKASPLCIAPVPMTFTCSELSGGFPDDLDASGLTSDEIDALLDTQFGSANGVDNCPTVTIAQTYVDNRSSCGTGTITRNFTVTDGQGFTSAPGCRQVITILGVHDYTVVFPGDRENANCVEPDYNGVTFEERGCDLITVATDIDTFSATADECYKLRITYEVLNWCEYNTEDDGYMIPRDADGDNNLLETTYLHIIPRDESTLSEDLAFLDRDNNRTNNTTIANLDTGDGGVLAGTDEAGYGSDGSRGSFFYQQYIKVYDETAPTLVVTAPDGGFCDLDGDCLAGAELEFTVSDDCSPESVSATVTLDAFINAGADGIYTLADFVADGGNVTAATSNDNGSFTTSLDNLPLGTHAIRIVATDGCGNTAIDVIVFEIIDCKAPTPICINGLTATLMPDGNGGGMAAIWASDFIASPSEDCAGEVKFALYRSTDAAVDGFEPNVLDTGLILTCADRGMLPVRVYAIDPNGQSDYCETTIFVQQNQDGICPGPAGTVAGLIATPNDEVMSGVEVNISDNSSMNEVRVTEAGLYSFSDLALGEDYTIQPVYDPSVNLANVSTGDLITLSRHILGVAEMTNAYQLLAGDVTQDNNINVVDIISIRRVILGLDNGFSATNSWRFYTEAGAEVFNTNNLSGNITDANFAAIEMGNVNALFGARTSLGLNIADQAIEAGNVYDVAVSSASMAGFQATIELAAGLELVNVDFTGANTAFNLNATANGLIAVSHVGGADAFTLKVRSTVSGQLSDLVSVSDRMTVSEAYNAEGVAHNLNVNFTTGAATGTAFELAQNSPNPFAANTMIKFELPTAAVATLTIQDIQGRVIATRTIEGIAGSNGVEVTTAELKGATGVLTYTLTAGDFTATKKMVVQ